MIASISDTVFSWEVSPFELVNFMLVCLLFTTVTWQYRELRKAGRGNDEQIQLAKTQAGQAAMTSQRTDDRIAKAYLVDPPGLEDKVAIPVIGMVAKNESPPGTATHL